VSGDITSVVAAVSCATVVAVTEPMAIPLLRRASAIDVPELRSSRTFPTPRRGGVAIALGLLMAAVFIHSAIAVSFAVAVTAFAVIGFADDLRVGSSRQRVTVMSAGGPVLLCLLGAVSLSGHLGLRVAADLAGLGVLAAYLRSPALLARTGALPEAGLTCVFSS